MTEAPRPRRRFPFDRAGSARLPRRPRRPYIDASPGEPLVTRWVEQRLDPLGGPAPSVEGRFAEMLRQVEETPVALEPHVEARIWRRLTAVAPTRANRLGTLRWLVLPIVLLTSGGVGAVVGIARGWNPPLWHRLQGAVAGLGASAASDTSRRRSRPRAPSASPEAPKPSPALLPSPVAPASLAPPEAASPQPAFAAANAHPPRRARAPLDLASAEPRNPATSLALEADILRRALVRLRHAHDAPGALAELEGYDARFPQGILRPEVEAGRVDALLMLDRKEDALRALDLMTLSAQGRGRELTLIRGELRATRDCAGAIADFSRVLGSTPSPPPALAERARHGRADCRERMGDLEGARADRAAYRPERL